MKKKDNLPKIDRAQLKDVSEVRIDTSLPCSERMKQYVEPVSYTPLDVYKRQPWGWSLPPGSRLWWVRCCSRIS